MSSTTDVREWTGRGKPTTSQSMTQWHASSSKAVPPQGSITPPLAVPNSATYWGPRVHTCLSPWFLQYLPMWSHLFCDHKSFLKLIEIKFICLAQFSPLSLNLQIQFPCLHFFLEVPKKFKTQIFAFLTIIYSLHHMSIILTCECRHTHAM